jgi:UDP-GlcNAc:undecaprenyl-phosphate GlcNAc-1-phosphate transferase
MSAELSPALGIAVAGAAVAGAVALVATPLAIRVARRLGFYDHPREYRRHVAPTPLLGGAAVIGALLVAAAVVGASGQMLVLLGCAVVLWLVGTIDDLVAVAPKWRLLAETGAALALILAGLRWRIAPGDVVLTVIWVVGLTNAFNLMDNLDGACGSVGCVSAIGIGTLAVLQGDSAVAGLAFALAAACATFLRWNLAGPARIFLGDGGSRPIGFIIAGLAMAVGSHLDIDDGQLVVGALMAGVVILDTALVTVSRMRRRVTVMTGGRDHLSHRLLPVLRAPRGVAVVLAGGQAILCAGAIVGAEWSSEAVGIFGLSAVLLGVVVIAVLDSPRWRPADIAVGVKLNKGRRTGAPSAAD